MGVSERMELEQKRNILKYQLLNIKKILASANIISLGDKYAADVVELAKILGLPKIPERIEGYDISNIFGKEAVGSMAVFSGGEPGKSEYRKFKIKINPGLANDVGMLKEVLERRFKHTSPPRPTRFACEGGRATPLLGRKGERWPLPDLIIVDGGKAQLNTALRVLREFKVNIPVLAVSKGSAREIPTEGWGASRISRAKGLRSARALDKIFFAGEKQPLELPLASPALHIIKRVRDEAHRFAIAYHRKLRKKNKFPPPPTPPPLRSSRERGDRGKMILE